MEGGLTLAAAFTKPPGLNPAKIVGVGSLPATRVSLIASNPSLGLWYPVKFAADLLRSPPLMSFELISLSTK